MAVISYLFATSMLRLSLLRIREWASKAGVTILGDSSALLTDGYECQHGHTIELMSFDPLVIYVHYPQSKD